MIFFVLLFVSAGQGTRTYQGMSARFDSLILQGTHYLYEENYVAAEKSFREAIELNSGDPAPYLGLTALYGLYMADFSTNTIEDKFFAYSDTTVMVAKQKINNGDSSGLVHLWLAGGYGARAFYKVWHKNIISGVQDGIKSIKEFYKAIEIDSSIYDAYIGIAGYDYFKHKLLSFVPWVEDAKWEDEIRVACNKGKYLRITATAGYALLLVEDKEFAKASEVVTPLVEKFPNSRTFRWIRVKSYIGMEAWDLAKDEYKKLLKLTLSGQPNNFYNIGCCRIGLARSHLMLNEIAQCKEQCKEVLNLPDTPKIKELKVEAEKLLKSCDNE